MYKKYQKLLKNKRYNAIMLVIANENMGDK